MTGRVWEPFLSDRDRAHLELLPRRQPVGFGTRPALLLIDNYRDVFGEERVPLLDAVRTNAAAIGEDAWIAAEHIRRLLEVARAVSVPVIHITGLADTGLPSWHASIHAGDRRGDLSVRGREDPRRYEIVEACAPLAGELVFGKSAPSAFCGTPLSGALTYLGIDTLVVAGESTSGCVRASVVDAASQRYRVVIAEECVYDRHQASHALNLFDMHMKYADVLSLAEVLARLRDPRLGKEM
jgi:nicotinamidase-related amidase